MASKRVVRGCECGQAAPMSRRAVLGGLSLLPLVAVNGVFPAAFADPADAVEAADTPYLYLSAHQAAVLDAATRRLVPGPEDDAAELGSPGAHEANVVRYLDIMLAAFSFSPPKVHAGGPWSNRAGRASLLRDRLAGVDCFATDMPYLSNNVTLDPTIKDLNGQPAPRVTYKIGKFEQASQDFFIPLLSTMCGASGAQLYAAVPQSTANSLSGTAPPTGLHTMGGMQMGVNPMTSVVDGNGRMHQMDNVFCADGSVFATSGGSNPTNTIMAVALRTARRLTGRRPLSLAPAPRRHLARFR